MMPTEFSMIHYKIIFLLFTFCLLSFGCSNVPDEMKIAERIMDTDPDSALHILQHLKPEEFKAPSNRALYGLLLFEALDNNDKPLKPDSLINYSLNYYLNYNDKPRLLACCFYKARKYKIAQQYDQATVFYLKALDNFQENKNYTMLGKIYTDMGDICSIQKDFKEALTKYQLAYDNFVKTGKKIEACFSILEMGRTYRLDNDYITAMKFYRKALNKTTDSLFYGFAMQEIGLNYYYAKQNDSAQFYLRKSLLLPYISTNYAIRCFIIADLYSDLHKYDSAFKYANEALKYPANFNTQRECYRILVNVEYLRKDIIQMGRYMTQYQNCSDSVRKVESQTKSSVLEKLHDATQVAKGTKRDMILIVSLLLILTMGCIYFIYFLYKRNKHKNEQLDIYIKQLHGKQEFEYKGLLKKIEETRVLQSDKRKNTSPDERIRLDKELYNHALYLNKPDDFNRLMNQAFNNIVETLKLEYPSITQKEITWCCLHLLDIPHSDRMVLLEASSDSLYKLKQRLAQKLNLKTTKELDVFLIERIVIKC